MRKLIDKGAFTKAYQIAEDKVEILTICPAKEAYALFSQGNKFAPIIEKVDYLDSGESVYHMPLYPKVTAPKKQLNKEAYAVYQALRKISGSCSMTYYRFIEEIEASNINEDDKEEIISLISDACNAIDTMDMGFEISPRNISVTETGDLIMLDCVFSRRVLRSTFNKKF